MNLPDWWPEGGAPAADSRRKVFIAWSDGFLTPIRVSERLWRGVLAAYLADHEYEPRPTEDEALAGK